MAKGEFACGLQTVGSFFKTLPLVVFREMVSMVTNLSNAPLVSVRDSPSLLVCTILFIFILYPFENVQMIQLERLNRTSLILMYIFCLLFWSTYNICRRYTFNYRIKSYIFIKNVNHWIYFYSLYRLYSHCKL